MKISRKEFKVLINDKEFFNLFSIGLKPIYQKRQVTSLYFDTLDFERYIYSKIIDVDNFKIRIRTYSNDNNFYKEIKENTFEGRKKFTEKLNIETFADLNTLNVKNVEHFPSLFVEYTREYFLYKNCRITYDSDIKFWSHKFRTKSKIKKFYFKNVLEFKNHDNNEDIEKHLLFPPISFSKYNLGVEEIYGIKK